MASSKELKIIKQAKSDYEKAKLKGDTKAMAAAHKKADLARGFSTTTKVNQQGNYYQSVKSAEPPKVQLKPTPQITRNAPAITKITPEQQAKNQKIAVQELQGKNGNVASFARGASLALLDPFSLRKLTPAGINQAQDEASKKNTFTTQTIKNGRAAFSGLAPLEVQKSQKTYEGLGEFAGSMVGVDPIGIGLTKGIQKGIQIANKSASKIPVLVNGKTKFVDATTQISKNMPTPIQPQVKPQPKMPAQAPISTVQPRNANLGIKTPQEQTFSQNVNIPKFKDLGADTNKQLPKYSISKVRTNTIENSPMFEKAKSYMDEPDYAYEVVSEKRSLSEAKQRLQADFDGEVEDLPFKSNFDGVDMDTAMGIMEQYIKEAEETGSYTRAKEWSKLIREKGTQGGQLIQSFAKYSRTPEGAVIKGQQTVDAVENQIKKTNPNLIKQIDETTKQVGDLIKKGDFTQEEIEKALSRITNEKQRKMTLQEIVDSFNNGTATADNIKDIIKSKYGVPTLTETDIKDILSHMKQADQFADGSYMKKMHQAKAEQIISDKVPAEFREKFRAMQRLSLILNPKTLITRNPLGNILLGTTENIKDIPATAIDKLVSLRTGQRTTNLAPDKLKAQAQGFGQGLKEWGQDIKYGVDTSPSRGQFELPSKRVFKGNFLNSMDMFLRRSLQLGDRPFYQAAYNSRLAELKKLGVAGEELETQARLYALDRVFQNDSELSKRAVQLRKLGGLPGDLLMPFTQTPANILDKLLDYTPAGLAKSVYQLGKTAGKGTFDQKKFVDTLGRTFTGAGIGLLAYAMFEKGILVGDLSENTDVRQAEQLAGKQAYSIKIGDTYYSYDWAQPIAGIFALVSNAMQAGADKEDMVSALLDAGVSSIDTVFEQSFLSGIMNAFSGYSPAKGIGNALLGSTSQATPTLFANVAKTIDPTVKETYDPNILKQQGNKLIARIPLASKLLPEKLDVTGQPIMQSQGRGAGNRTFENFLAPQRISQETGDKVNNELLRLQKATGDNAVLLNKAKKYIEESNEKYQLSPEEYNQYQREMGQKAYSDIQKLSQTQWYKNMSEAQKADMISKINKQSKDLAEYSVLTARGIKAEPVKVVNYTDQTEYEFAQLSKQKQEKYSLVANSGIGKKDYTYLSTHLDVNDNNSITQDEVKQVLGLMNLTQEQKAALWPAINKGWKNNPYK